MALIVFVALFLYFAITDPFGRIILAVSGVFLALRFLYWLLHSSSLASKREKTSAIEKVAPKFKKKGGQLLASSMTEENVWYVIDPEQATCTCPDWVKKRSGEPLHLPSRVCTHLAKYYENRAKKTPEPLQPWRRVIRRFAEHNLGVPISNVAFAVTEDGDHVMIDFYAYPKSGWINVHADYFEYGYNPVEKRWSYKREPQHADLCVRIIHDHLAGKIPIGGPYLFAGSI